jgi:hypothetical protein
MYNKGNQFLGKNSKKKKITNVPRSLFKDFSHIEDTLVLLDFILKNPEACSLVSADNGLYTFESVLDAIVDQNEELDYLTDLHMAEVYLRDPEGILRIEDYGFGRRTDNVVEPPDVLFFGTTEYFKEGMKSRGIQSKSKGFVRLFDTVEEAEKFSKRFEGESAVLAINAFDAHKKGIKFSASGRPGEYLTESISPKFIN